MTTIFSPGSDSELAAIDDSLLDEPAAESLTEAQLKASAQDKLAQAKLAEAAATATRPRTVLLIEDNDTDHQLLEYFFAHHARPHRLRRVSSGPDAFEYLHDSETFESRPRPDLILLDLVLPGVTGAEVLDRLKRHPDWQTIPVIVYTDAVHDLDALQNDPRTGGAAAYLIKPKTIAEMQTRIRQFADVWSRSA